MTYYRNRTVLGCVVREFKGWQHHPSSGPIRIVLGDKIRNLHMNMDDQTLEIQDVEGNTFVVHPGDYVFDYFGGLEVLHPADFEAEYEESPRG